MSDFDFFRNKFAPKAAGAAPAPAAPELVVNRDKLPYEAFGTKDRLHRVDLRASDGLAHALPYSHLLLLTYNRRTYGEIFMTISGMTASIRGRNLRPVIDALKLHTCEFVQAFDADEFAKPEDDGAPFIERVDVELIRGVQQPTRKEA